MKKTGNPKIDESTASVVVGSDEVGFGSWAGPLVVAAVATPRNWEDSRVKDSKKLSPRQREALYKEFWQLEGFPMAVQIVEPADIDSKGIWNCLIEAHQEAAASTFWRLVDPPLVIVDGNVPVEKGIPLPKADLMIPAVSLASIIAKVTRDRLMTELAKKYPGYGFEKHFGYGTPLHQEALNILGPCSIHRQSFDPVARATREAEYSVKDVWELFEG